MNKGLYFWKSSFVPNKKQGIMLGIILVIILAATAGWYFLFYTPHKQHDLELQNKKTALEQQIKQVSTFYEDQLKGGSIDRFSLLLNEMYKSRLVLGLTGYNEIGFSCKTDNCTFSYVIKPSHVFNVQKKVFWGKSYSSSFSNKGISFSGIPAKLNDNIVLQHYSKGKNIDTADCGQVLSYIYAFNSINKKSDQITIVKPPASSVLDVEEKIKGNTKYYGLLFGSWTVKAKDDIVHLMSLFERQAFRDSFIIKGIEFKSKEVNISGGFVCKSGN